MLWREFKHDLPTSDEMKCIKTTTRLVALPTADELKGIKTTARLSGVRVVSVDLNYLAQDDHSLTMEEQIKTVGHIAEWDFNETVEALQEHYLQGINDPLSRDTPNLRNTLLFATLIFTYKKA